MTTDTRQDHAIELRVQLTQAELYHASLRLMTTLGWYMWVYGIGGLVGSIVTIVSLVSGERPPMLALFLAVMLLWTLVAPWIAIRRNPISQRAINGITIYRFDDQGVSTDGESARGSYDWSAITHVRQFPEFYLIHWSRTQALPVPVRCFASAAEELEFQGLLVMNVGDRFRMRRR